MCSAVGAHDWGANLSCFVVPALLGMYVCMGMETWTFPVTVFPPECHKAPKLQCPVFAMRERALASRNDILDGGSPASIDPPGEMETSLLQPPVGERLRNISKCHACSPLEALSLLIIVFQRRNEIIVFRYRPRPPC